MAVLIGAVALLTVASIVPEEPEFRVPDEVAAVEEPEAEEPEVVVEPYGVWDRLMQCEAGSSGQWRANTGNGYYGGLQMDMTFWRRYGGMAYAARPNLASREIQIQVARRGLAVQGWGAWPACSRRLGLR